MPQQTPVGRLPHTQREGNVIRDASALRGTHPSTQRMLGNVGVHRRDVGQRVVLRHVHLDS
jgi:hypothetical protein